MGNRHNLTLPENDDLHTYIYMSDIHSLFCDPIAVNAALSFIQLIPIKQRRLILGGDILDFAFLFGKNPCYLDALKQHDWDGYFIPELEREIIWFDGFYEKISKLFPYCGEGTETLYILGNHEGRTYRENFIGQVAHNYRHNFDMQNIVRAEERHIRIFPYNDYLSIFMPDRSELLWTHGTFCGANPIRKHVYDVHTDIIFGHTHEIGEQNFKSPGRTITGINNGCLCYISPEKQPPYLDNKNQNWGHSITVTTVLSKSFGSSVVRIQDGKIMLATGEVL